MAMDVLIPQIGESVSTVFIAKWRVKVGDFITSGAPIVDLDSDKASMEVPSPGTGRIQEILVSEGDEVPVGSVVARLDESATQSSVETAAAPAPAPVAAPADVKAGPAARAAATVKGVELGGVAGSGKGGRVTTADVAQAAAPAPVAAPASKPVAAPAPAVVAAPRAPTGDRVERVKMSPLRRTIARRLVEAQATAAMLTTFNEVDLSAAMAMRKRYQDSFVEKHGVKLGFMSFFVKAAVEALKEFPAVNAEIEGTEILYKRYYNIGVAVSGPKGLVVPVVRDADRLSFAEVEKSIAALGKRAKDNKLDLADFEDGTFTVSNGGTFGSMMSTPILNPPQSGILGMHNIVDRAVVVDGQIVIRPMMYLALTYDHRIIDGREAVSFLVRIKQCVENPERMLLEV